MRHAPSKDDIQMINYLIDCEIPFIVILTKADKLKPMARKARMEAFETEIPCFQDITCIPFSTVTGEGVEEVRAILDELSEGAEIVEPETVKEEPEQSNDDAEQEFTGFLTPRGRKK